MRWQHLPGAPRAPPNINKCDCRNIANMTAAELKTWGYKEVYVSYIQCDMARYWKVESACKALGLDTRPKESMGGDNRCYNFQHFDKDAKIPKKDQTYKVNSKEYRATGAQLEFDVNPVGGAIFMQYVTSPQTAAQNVWNKKPSLDELPELRNLSDLMWGAWNRENSDVSKIKYFWVQGVGNSNSKAVMARALKAAGKQLEQWPGTTFEMKDDGALAMLGSENGACFGFFLAQHKKELGNMVIDQVQVFKNDRNKNPDPDLLFHVRAAATLQKREMKENSAEFEGEYLQEH